MADGAAGIFDSSGFLPHGICLLWQPELLTLHVASDVLTGLAYYSIPVALIYFVWRRRDVAFGWIFWLFAAFILVCGTTHFFSVWTLWNPDYGLEGIVKAVTALTSVLTAVALWILMPRALALPGPAHLRVANEALQREIQERRQTEERYASFFNNLAESLFVITVQPDGRFLIDTLNPAHVRATGLDPAVVHGRLPEEVLPAEAAVHVTARYSECVAAGRAIDYEETLELPGGRRTWHTVLVPVRDAAGRIVQLLGSSRDVTERLQLQEELVQASKLATLGTLAAGMAHEMSQPLNIIRIWAENALSRLRDNELDQGRTEKVLTLVAEQTDRMGKIIDHMRTFSRRDGGGSQLFDPVESVRSAIDLVSHQYALEGVEVMADLTQDPCTVRGRPFQLEQVVLNLLSNARDAVVEQRAKSGLAGRIRVDYRVPSDRQSVLIAVTDDGGGIEQEVLSHIFDPFFTTKEVGKGSGLGLSIGYGIIDSMRGRIEAVNVELDGGRRGVRFTITLPAARPSVRDVEHAHA